MRIENFKSADQARRLDLPGESGSVKNWKGTAFNVLMLAFVMYLAPFVLVVLDCDFFGSKFYQQHAPAWLSDIFMFLYAPVCDLIDFMRKGP